MNEMYYKDALKLAQKEVRACEQQGKPTSLPVLDDIVSSSAISKGTDLGIVHVPAEFIIGTKTRGSRQVEASLRRPPQRGYTRADQGL